MDAEIQAYNNKELAHLYGVTPKTFRAWQKKIIDLGEKIGKRWTLAQVKKIFNHLGTPEKKEIYK